MLRVGINGKSVANHDYSVLEYLVIKLKESAVAIHLSSKFHTILKKANHPALDQFGSVLRSTQDYANMDLVFSLGGDGTLLETVSYVGSTEKPILGINTGRLGFLATTHHNKIDATIQSLVSKRFTVDTRSLVQLECEGKNPFGNLNFGLNEFTILKRDTSSMIVVHTYLNGDYINAYWADGLIIATPTGSTGYNLSCGGPLVLPQSQNFIVTPVSPHNLNVRPLIISDSGTLTFQVESRSNSFLISLDSRSKAVDTNFNMQLKKAPFKAQLIKPEGYNYFDTLRQKLNWGLDLRN
ncbi:MAG: NAD kinase [Cyclobacteriaceae bacterium]|nr:NAD kinase [Cyclobacteriaceae bacterium]MCH8515453.1 NAD kinase [Cyclobacteriaceae bacterium]